LRLAALKGCGCSSAVPQEAGILPHRWCYGPAQAGSLCHKNLSFYGSNCEYGAWGRSCSRGYGGCAPYILFFSQTSCLFGRE
jgi:hypothetical protein